MPRNRIGAERNKRKGFYDGADAKMNPARDNRLAASVVFCAYAMPRGGANRRTSSDPKLTAPSLPVGRSFIHYSQLHPRERERDASASYEACYKPSPVLNSQFDAGTVENAGSNPALGEYARVADTANGAMAKPARDPILDRQSCWPRVNSVRLAPSPLAPPANRCTHTPNLVPVAHVAPGPLFEVFLR